MIEQLEGFPENVAAFAGHGWIMRQDYEDVLIPAVEAAFKFHDKMRLYYEIGVNFTGIEPGAVVEDVKVAINHLGRWERIAVVSDVNWIRLTVRVFGALMPGCLTVFETRNVLAARTWIAQPELYGPVSLPPARSTGRRSFRRHQGQNGRGRS